ncbi:MAG: hypothetical protein CMC08_02835 [Flavobacteriaceae bacterium]|nr:hypothetical protein [Flavobacteriaceae bacterium]
MKNILKITLVAGLMAFFTGCETTELELLESPNNITAESADPNFVLNDIQLTFRGIFSGYNTTSTELIRMDNLFSTYNGLVDVDNLNGEWQQSYQMFSNIDLLNQINDLRDEDDKITNHLGVAQTLEAWAYMLLVEYLGDVPYSQANMPEEFPNPALDDGSAVYDAQIELLDQAIANLSAGSIIEPNDLYYGAFDPAQWIALANSLKLRAFNNIRLVQPSRSTAGINAVLNSQDFINTVGEDFQFEYGTAQPPVESRHPRFQENYLAAGAGEYMSNQFLDFLNAGDDQPPFIETGVEDPRLRYYIYRQTDNAPSGSNLPCADNPVYEYCYVGNLYWGRDHADDEGIPNDGTRRSTYGIYPAGGAFDKNQFEQARAVETMEGAGIEPMWLSSFTHFVLAEAALTLGTGGGSPASLLEQGIRLSMEKVLNFPTLSTVNSADGVDYAATQAEVDAYVGRVISEYNSASGEDAKLAVIMREYMLAAWGNGIEPYNNYRRTGLPELQAPIYPAGPFPRAFRYPSTETVGNPNIQQQPLTTQVFWDNNPAGFID